MKAYAVLMNVKGNKSNHNGEVYKAAPLLCFIFGRDKNESIKVAYDAIVDSIPVRSIMLSD